MVELPLAVVIAAVSLLLGAGGSYAVTKFKAGFGISEIKELRTTLVSVQIAFGGMVEKLSHLYTSHDELRAEVKDIKKAICPETKPSRRKVK